MAIIVVPARRALPLLPKFNDRNLPFSTSTPTSAVDNALVVIDPPTIIAMPDRTLAIDSLEAYPAFVATIVNLFLNLLAQRCAGRWLSPSFIAKWAHCLQRSGGYFCLAGSSSLIWLRSLKQVRRVEIEGHFLRVES